MFNLYVEKGLKRVDNTSCDILEMRTILGPAFRNETRSSEGLSKDHICEQARSIIARMRMFFRAYGKDMESNRRGMIGLHQPHWYHRQVEAAVNNWSTNEKCNSKMNSSDHRPPTNTRIWDSISPDLLCERRAKTFRAHLLTATSLQALGTSTQRELAASNGTRLGREQVELFADPDELTSRATGISIDTIRECDDPVLRNSCCIAGNPARKKRFRLSSNDGCSTSVNKAAVTQEKGKRGRRPRNAAENKNEKLSRIFKTKEANELVCANGAGDVPNYRILEETPKSRKSYEVEDRFRIEDFAMGQGYASKASKGDLKREVGSVFGARWSARIQQQAKVFYGIVQSRHRRRGGMHRGSLRSPRIRLCIHIFPPTERRCTTLAVMDPSSNVPLLLNASHCLRNSNPSPILFPTPVLAQPLSLPLFVRQAHPLLSKGIVPSSSLLY
ncbi:hypothetical protein Y032_0066g3688 [Ancylostoma ceylanicum]|uniref:Uncharacterized protein n=2 Tax=Ancylostoma ceylanicum TaxID=53326 RepID=A0A016U105_9BILA|nr:hypothetical protein Y032_0066g3688 [Ancylostoma ceylanicum]